MATLTIIPPFHFRGFEVPEATAAIDWVSFDRVNKTAQFVIGIYRTPAEAATHENRLETVALSYSGKQYEQLIAESPALYGGIVSGVFTLAVASKPELFLLKE